MTVSRYTADELKAMVARGEDPTDWARVDAMTEEQIERNALEDLAELGIPEDWSKDATFVRFQPKASLTIRLDRDIVDWFKRGGRGYQTRINEVLRTFVEAQRRG